VPGGVPGQVALQIKLHPKPALELLAKFLNLAKTPNLTRRSSTSRHVTGCRRSTRRGLWLTVGGLMSYSANYAERFRRSAGYVDRLLKGATPADLRVEQPTNFELIINLKTAKALGQSAMRRAGSRTSRDLQAGAWPGHQAQE
jgi:hypothetical protein